ncbi:hypothetical protein Clacol_000933 [Clathrus columnatus]|uniref:Uncharacterized protein n=1 Tax=Clathrus columnatus TaxID=1419009 RepID=A0AAV4ZXE1_9AGAM|nr:hypothetical protein Clacol_000933 [Clathrus columnatus]
MAASGSTNINVFPIPIPISINDDEEDQQPILSPKPPTLDQDQMHRENYVAEVLAEDDIDIVSTDPPPPYPSSNRGSRRTRTNLRSVRITSNQVIEDSVVDDGGGTGDTERTPLLPVNRRRAASHSSMTTPSINSIGHTVLSSSRNVISLFQSDPDNTLDITTTTSLSSDVSFSTRIGRYFRPLVKRAYYSAVFHLLFINFPYELVAWIYLFAGTLTGTTLLITLPLGIILCFLDLIGARAFARGEIYLQTLFHGPLSINAPNPPNPLFSRMRTPESISDSEMGEPVPETSFLKLAYLMFRDPTSYQALFYFLVIKPGITLLIALGILILLPPAFILILPAPAVLRAIRRVGIWQAEIALDALK